MELIDRDLIQWRRGKWMAVIGVIFLLQLGVMIWAAQKQLRSRTVYPEEPKVAFGELQGGDGAKAERTQLENPFLFAAASHDGFSGEAWLKQPAWIAPEPVRRTYPGFLQLSEVRNIIPTHESEQPFTLAQRRRATSVYPTPAAAPAGPLPVSELKLAGFAQRGLAVPLPLPLQYHTDVLTPSVVEAMIDRDGLVISARLIENSGSVKADLDAMALARRARFRAAPGGETVPESGKLIFEWFALDLGHTNNVKR